MRELTMLVIVLPLALAAGGGRKFTGAELKERMMMKNEDPSYAADVFPMPEARERAPSLRQLSTVLNETYHALKKGGVPWNWRRCTRGCKFVRYLWREKQRGGMRDDPLLLPMRSVDGTSVKTLPIERFHRLKLYNRTIFRAYVDDDAWKAKRWVFIDLGARYMVRKKKPFYGSTFSFICGYPGAEKFDYYGFDINAEDYAPVFPPFVKLTTGAVWNQSGHIVIKGKAAGSFATTDAEVDEEEHEQSSEKKAEKKAVAAPEEEFRKVPAVDFASWLIERVKPEDFVVVKMDIENAEFRVMDKLFETGAMELIDEVFIECHGELTKRAYKMAGIYYNWAPPAWVRSEACHHLETKLRRHGVFLHEWD
eukprot:Hpha_TRINITY_DN13413_c0_g2::TRINITY_DN13413_c0_g2_i1::g.131184::m.131184